MLIATHKRDVTPPPLPLLPLLRLLPLLPCSNGEGPATAKGGPAGTGRSMGASNTKGVQTRQVQNEGPVVSTIEGETLFLVEMETPEAVRKVRIAARDDRENDSDLQNVSPDEAQLTGARVNVCRRSR